MAGTFIWMLGARRANVPSGSPIWLDFGLHLLCPARKQNSVPIPQVLIYGDGLAYQGFLRSSSVADLPTMDWNKLAGLTTFVMLRSFAPFEDEPPFYSHRTIVGQLVSGFWTLGSAGFQAKWGSVPRRSCLPAGGGLDP